MPVGYIQDELDLKLLVLYITARAAGPLTFLQLWELAQCDAGVDYFFLTQAVAHMTATGQLLLEEGCYTITEKGRRNIRFCESSLPLSVRMHCDESLVKVNQLLRQQSQVQTGITNHDGGSATLRLALEDNTSSLLQLELFAPSREQAERWAEAFRADPTGFYLGLTRLLEAGDPRPTQEEST